MRYEMEGRNLFVMPDSPVLRHYRVDYPNVAREARSSVSASSSIGSGGGNSGGSGTGNSSSSSLANTSNNRFWETLTQNIRDLLRETDRFVPEGSNTGQQMSQAAVIANQVMQANINAQAGVNQTPSGANGSVSAQSSRTAGSTATSGAANSTEHTTLRFREAASVIASRLNLTQEHFSRILHELSALELIRVEGRRLRIPDLERLARHQCELAASGR
jgi:general secretion pathway protein D